MARKSKIRAKIPRRSCRGCGEVFQPRRKGHYYHKSRCRNLSWRTKHRTIRLALESIDDHEVRLRAIEKKLGLNKKGG